MNRTVEYITGDELAAHLRTDRDGTVVLDVRDEDFNELGHVAGCVHIDAWEILGDPNGTALEEFIRSYLRRSRTRRVVVHCYLSMQRGPAVAHRLRKRLEELEDQGDPLLSPADVYVLKRGFRAFFTAFKGEEDLVVVH